MKLRVKMLLALSALSLTFSLVMVAERTLGLRQAMLERTKDRTDYLSDFISELSSHYIKTGNIARLKEILRSFDHFKNINYLEVSDAKGAVIYRMAESGLKISARPRDPDVFHPGDELFDAGREIVADGEMLGTVRLGVSVLGVDEAAANLAWRGTLIGVVFTAFITMAAWALSIKLGKELNWLLDLAENVNSEKLPELPDGALGSDTGSIARTLKTLHGRLRAEERRRKEAEAVKNDFFEMTVHDLKQPVTALKASLDLLLNEDDRRSYDKRQIDGLSAIARSSLALLTRMISDVLNTAKLNNPQYQPERERIDLLTFLNGCVPENAASVAAAGKRWEYEAGPGLAGCWVFGDADLIRRVIGNLVLNAIHYTPEGGKIKLGARLRDSERVCLYVSDEGEGIPDSFRQEIFKKYSTMSRSPKNLGLGLAFCKLAADRHAAFLDVKSEPGHGTEISFVLPVYCPAARAGAGGKEGK